MRTLLKTLLLVVLSIWLALAFWGALEFFGVT